MLQLNTDLFRLACGALESGLNVLGSLSWGEAPVTGVRGHSCTIVMKGETRENKNYCSKGSDIELAP